MQDPPPFENDRYATPPSEPTPEPIRRREPKPNTPPRKWYRFTLWKMVVAFVLLGVVFAYLRYTHWGYVLSENITRVGRSFGLAEQRDPNKIYVSAVRPLGRDNWEWSVELPQGQLYVVCLEKFDVPVTGIPAEVHELSRDVPWSYNFLVDYRVERLHGQLGFTKDIHYFDPRFVAPRSVGGFWNGVGRYDWMYGNIQREAISMSDGVQVFELGEKIVLLRQWPADSNPPNTPGATHEEGIMIWIEPAPAKGPWNKFLQQTAPTAGK